MIFLHIRKVGGSTFGRFLRKSFSREMIYSIPPLGWHAAVETFGALPQEERYRYRLLTGHMEFGLGAHSRPPAAYVTILRHPVDRVISSYYHMQREGRSSENLRDIVERGLSIPDILEERLLTIYDNWQTRLLAGKLYAPVGGIDTHDLQVALERLDEFTLVGLTHRMKETMFLAHVLFPDVALRHVARRNVGRNRPSGAGHDQGLRDLIEEHNQLDLRLVAEAERRFQELMDGLTAAQRLRMATFDATDRLFQPIAVRARRGRNALRRLRDRVRPSAERGA